MCKVTNSGEIKNRKSVNVPGVNMRMPSLTEKMRALSNGLVKMILNLSPTRSLEIAMM